MLKPVDPRPNFPAIEDAWVKKWKKNRTFEKSVEFRPKDKPWVFLDGPPFITGMPHYGTLLSSIPKDVFARFWTMKGYHVRRVWGWDCHGLPAETKVENKLGITRKKDIEEKIGVKKFIDECISYVSEVSAEWEWYVDHIGRWVDFKNAYRTMDMPYMESVMWVFKELYDKGYIYKGKRISLYAPDSVTPISNFEIAMDNSYAEITEPANTYKYKLVGEDKTYILAWSTTPWNKIVTTALAVNPEFTYVKVKQNDEHIILAESRLEILTDAPYTVEEKISGKDLVGRKYEPHYDYFTIEDGKKAYEIVAADFVTDDSGAGVVTIAPYGEDDFNLMNKLSIHMELHLDEEGHFKPEVPKFGGMYYLKANPLINADLVERGLMYKEEPYTHSVPLNHRTGVRLYYAPQDAWYVDIQKLKKELEKNNENVRWFPEHFKNGRFLKSLQNAPDWCLSRSRYWGSPIPVWETESGERFVVGSIGELEKLSGVKVTSLHKPEIDDVTFKSPTSGEIARRVPEVLDSWMEAASASFAERHYPFNSKEKPDDFFPPDFIVEYTGQIRAWFYVLHVIGAALMGSHAFKNVIVTGVILGTDGRKMSKNWGNYPDPKLMLEKHGGDALRMYLLGSPVMKGEDLIFSEDDFRNYVKVFMLPMWNILKFYALYDEMDGVEYEKSETVPTTSNILDEWIIELTHKLVNDVTAALEGYDTMSAVKPLVDFVDDWSKWYVRRSRDRVGVNAENGDDKKAYYSTMYYVFATVCKVAAPITPFISEEIYTHVTGKDSVHLQDWPTELTYDQVRLDTMNIVRELVEAGHRVRKAAQIKVRQPLASVTLYSPKGIIFPQDQLSTYADIMQDELNVKHVKIVEGKDADYTAQYDTVITDELKKEGEARELVRAVQQERQNLGLKQSDRIHLTVTAIPDGFKEYIAQKVLADSVIEGSDLQIERIS